TVAARSATPNMPTSATEAREIVLIHVPSFANVAFAFGESAERFCRGLRRVAKRDFRAIYVLGSQWPYNAPVKLQRIQIRVAAKPQQFNSHPLSASAFVSQQARRTLPIQPRSRGRAREARQGFATPIGRGRRTSSRRMRQRRRSQTEAVGLV